MQPRQQAYAEAEPARFVVLDASRPPGELAADIRSRVAPTP